MNIGTNGLVVNEFGQVLLIQRDDTRTWALPGGSLDAGELPTVGVAREVEEETGLKVLPVRLVGVDYWAARPYGYLIFLFRCLVRGGGLTPSEESPQVGFYPVNALPNPMFGMHQERLGNGYRHSGGPPYWRRQHVPGRIHFLRRFIAPLIYGAKAVRRRWWGLPRYVSPLPWGVGAFVVIRDGDGRVLWVRRHDYDVWNLPGGGCEAHEAPWEAAEFAYFAPGEEPPNTLPKQVERAADAARNLGQTVFKVQAGRPGLEVLGVKRET
jgi:ADP-ribose pyrophosphatase YjhB (NUDIX family)